MVDQITRPYKIIGEHRVTYVLIFMFSGATGRENIPVKKLAGIARRKKNYPCKDAYLNIVKVQIRSEISLDNTEVRKLISYLETLKMLNFWEQL